MPEWRLIASPLPRPALAGDVNTLPRTTETLYDYAGNKSRVYFPEEGAGRRSQQWLDYDAFGQPGRFIDERGNTTDLLYCWGPMKKLCTVTTHRIKDGGGTENQPTAFWSDPVGRPIRTVFPDASYEESSYQYGQLISWRTRKGQTKYIHYDARGREDSNSWQNANGTCDPATDMGAADCVVRQWDAASRLNTIRNKVSTIQYTYDDAAQVRTEQSTVAGSNGPAQLSYFRYGDGAIARLGYPNGLWIGRDYTARGELKRVYDSAAGWKATVEYGYWPDGKVKRADYADNTRTEYEYGGRAFLSSFRTSNRFSGQEIYKRNYYRDERDRITILQRGNNNPANLMENGHGDRFRYDEEGQLVEAWYDAPNPVNTGYGNARYELFNYDALGNRQFGACLGRLGWQTFSRKDNGLNQYSMWSPFSVVRQDDDIGAPWGTAGNANGVTMQEGNITAGYNALNQMVLVTIPGLGSNWRFFGYDPLGRRVQQWEGALGQSSQNNYVPPIDSSPGTFFYYDGWNLVQDGPSAFSASRNYIHGARVDEIVKQFRPSDGWERYFHYEGRGHCAFQTDAGGNIVEQYEYDAFGQPYFYSASGYLGYSPWGNRFLFTGREYLADLRLYDYRNRMYQPELGRFLQPDPKHFAAGDYNLYRYCHNDPVNKSDPAGLASFNGQLAYQRWGVRLGSLIPQWLTKQTFSVNFTTSGNYDNPNLSAHESDKNVYIRGALAKGWTDPSVGVKANTNNTLTANLHIDWFIRRGMGPFIAYLEKQHTFGDTTGGSTVKGLLEAGGYWSQMQSRHSTISGRFWDGINSARDDLEGILQDELLTAKGQQINVWDRPGANHYR